MRYEAIIVGGGAAGLFCAAEAGKRGRKVLLIEHNAQLGRKIIISGGGRCNFTNLKVHAENFVSANPHFAKSALARYTPDDFIELVKKHRIRFYEKKLGQLFCRDSSRQIVDLLADECTKAGVEILLDCSVTKISRSGVFTLDTNKGRFESDKLVIATGGLSFPKIGASGFGYETAKQFGLKIVQTRPSLVALRFRKGSDFSKLAGISVDSNVNVGKTSFREKLLFTHKGLSGPAILQISNYWRKNVPVLIDLMPETDLLELLRSSNSNQSISNFLGKYMPARVADEMTHRYFPDVFLKEISREQIIGIAETINNWQVLFSETEGWHKAEVTLGGVDTDAISSQTMEAKNVSGLYFIGEVLDVTGWLGGYNFQWAWSSAYACGSSL